MEDEEEDKDEVEDRFSGDAQEEQQFDSGSEHSRETFFDPSLIGISTAHARSKSSGRKSKGKTIKKRRKRSVSAPEDADTPPKRRPLSTSFHTNRSQQRLKNHPGMAGTTSKKILVSKRKDVDSDDESVVDSETQIQKLKLDNYRLKKRQKYGATQPKKGSKGVKLTAMQREVRKKTKSDLWPVKKFFSS